MQLAHDDKLYDTYTLYDLYEGKVTRNTFFTSIAQLLVTPKSIEDWHPIMRTYLQELTLFLSDLAKESKTLKSKDAAKNYIMQAHLLRNWLRLSSFVKH